MSSQKKTIKQKIAELDEILLWFESNDFDVEEAVIKYEEAKKLIDNTIDDLSQLKNKLIIAK